MMILSRLWYVILALLLAAAYYIVALAVGQYNRRNQAAMEEELKGDSQVVSWAMQVDARRRLDAMFLISGDANVQKALKGANGKDPIPPASRDDGVKALRAFNDKLPPDYKNDVIFVADREGRMVAQIGYDTVNSTPDFELGGYAAVFDALHGFIRDDTWVWGGKIARVVARPVEDEVGQPPLGAVIGLRWVDNAFAKEIGKRTRANLAFFAVGSTVAHAATQEGFEDALFDTIGTDLATVSGDKQFKEQGRTDVKPLPGDKGGILYVRIPGDAWELGAGFAVARQKVAIDSPLGFINGADDQDKRNVKMWLVGVIALGALLFGFLFSFLEHSMPIRELARQAVKLKRGEIDAFALPKFRGGLRPIAADVNEGMQRVVEKGGGTGRKPADLESILGPVPAQPSMSAFSFPLDGGPQSSPNAAAGGGNFPANAPNTGNMNRLPPSGPGGGPPPPANRPAGGPPPPTNARPATPGPAAAPPPGNAAFGAPERTVAMPGAQNPNFPGSQPNVPAAAPAGTGPNRAAASPAAPPAKKNQEEEQTMVANPSADLIAASGAGAAAADPNAEWHQVYEEFIKTKKQCGEPTDGLTFEKFEQTLKKNRDALIQRHGCKRVKFSVYVKEGRASLKATPVRE